MENWSQEELDKEIGKMKLEYEIDAVSAQIKQEKQKMLQAQKTWNSSKSKSEELQLRITELRISLGSL